MLHYIVVNEFLVCCIDLELLGIESHTVFVWFVVKVGVVWVHLSPTPFPPPSQEVCSGSVPKCRSVLTGAFHSDWYFSPLTHFLPQTLYVNVFLSVWSHALLSCCLTDALTLSPVFWEQITVWVKDQSTRLPFLLPPAFTPIFHPTQTQQPSLRSSISLSLSSCVFIFFCFVLLSSFPVVTSSPSLCSVSFCQFLVLGDAL